jgi:hypothetical protein
LDRLTPELTDGLGDAAQVLDGCERHAETGGGSGEVLDQHFLQSVVSQAIRRLKQR